MEILVVLEEYIQGISVKDIFSDTHQYSGGIGRLTVFNEIRKILEGRIYIYGNIAKDTCGNVSSINDLEGINPDVIIYNNPPTLKSLLKFHVRYPNAKKIIWFGNPIKKYMLGYLYLNLIDEFVCVSKYHKSIYNEFKIKERISYIYSGTNIKENNVKIEQKDQNKYCWISAPVKSKGIQNLFSLWEAILSINSSAKLDLFGSLGLHGGDENKIFQDDIAKLAAKYFEDPAFANSVKIRGLVSKSELYACIAESRYCIVNLNYEGSFETFCASAIEAQQLGCCVIGGDYGSLPEVTMPGISSILLRRSDFQQRERLLRKLSQKLKQNFVIPVELTSQYEIAKIWCDRFRTSRPRYRYPSLRDVILILGSAMIEVFRDRYVFQRKK